MSAALSYVSSSSVKWTRASSRFRSFITSTTFDHFFLTLQAAIDGIGIAMGPTALVSDDLAAGRLVAPFAGPRLPSRSYCTYVPDAKSEDELVVLFRSWLEREGMRSPDGNKAR